MISGSLLLSCSGAWVIRTSFLQAKNSFFIKGVPRIQFSGKGSLYFARCTISRSSEPLFKDTVHLIGYKQARGEMVMNVEAGCGTGWSVVRFRITGFCRWGCWQTSVTFRGRKNVSSSWGTRKR
jgi:hypothetical protein